MSSETVLTPFAGRGGFSLQRTATRFAVFASTAAVFLAPYTTWRVVPGLLFTWSDCLFCLVALFLLTSGKQNINPFRDLTPLWFAGLGLMLAGLLLGSAVNGDVERWLVVAGQYCFAYGFLPVLLNWNERAHAIRASIAIVAGIVAMEAFGTAFYVATGADYDRAQAISPEFITGGHRLGGFMADANWNGAMSAMAIPFVVYLAGASILPAFPAYIALAILFCGVILSGSFTGFTSAAVGLLLMLLIGGTRKSARLVGALMLFAALGVAGGLALPEAFEHRVYTALENRDINEAGTYSGRVELMEEAWDVVAHTPVIGIGVDQFRIVSAQGAPVHNMYLLMWAEGGILALLGWLLIVIVPIIASIRARRIDRSAAGLCLAVSSIFTIFSLAAPHMYSRSWSIPLLIALAVAITRSGSESSSSSPV